MSPENKAEISDINGSQHQSRMVIESLLDITDNNTNTLILNDTNMSQVEKQRRQMQMEETQAQLKHIQNLRILEEEKLRLLKTA